MKLPGEDVPIEVVYLLRSPIGEFSMRTTVGEIVNSISHSRRQAGQSLDDLC
jgi:hypothetical protein